MNWEVICAIVVHVIGLFTVINGRVWSADANGLYRTSTNNDTMVTVTVNGTRAGHSPLGRREIVFGFLWPNKGKDADENRTYQAMYPVIDLAIRKVQRPGGLLEGFKIRVEHRDTKCSSAHGPLAAFELYTTRKPG